MFQNEYLLDMDLKFVPSFLPPRFRRGDTAILKFRLHDNGVMYDASQYDKAEITIEMPSKVELVDFGKKERINGVDIISFQFAPIHMVEVGIYTIYLTLIKGEDRVSATPIKVRFFDNLSQEDLSFVTIIEDLQKEIERMQLEVAKGINTSEIGAPNGVASLDGQKKVPDSQMPKYVTDHLTAIMRSDNGAHGFRITANGIALYKDNDGAWNNVIFADKPIGGGLSPHTPPIINISEGIVTIKFPDGDIPTIQKWDAGERDIPWFATNGFAFVGSGFQVSAIGSYTLYYKLQDGREFVVVFAVTEANLPVEAEGKKPIKDIPDGTVVKIGDKYWQVLDAKKGFLWYADEYPVRLTTAYDTDIPRANRTRDFSPNKTSHSAYKINTDFYDSLPEDFKNAIKSSIWNNGDENNEGSKKVEAKLGYLTVSEWNRYKDVLKYMNKSTWEKWSYTMTKDSEDEKSIFIYTDDYSNNPRLLSFDIFQFESSEGLDNVADARPVVYVDIDFEVDFSDESEVALEPISNFNEGDTVKLGGVNWILIDKATRKLVARDPVHSLPFSKKSVQTPLFDPTDEDNLAYWLNNDFYNSLPSSARKYIVSSTWDTRLVEGSTDRANPLVEARVGLLSKKDIDDKKSVLTHFVNSMSSWLVTYGNVPYSTAVLHINDDGSIGTVNYWNADARLNVNPVVYLTSNAKVSRVKFSNTEVSKLSTGEYVNIGGFEWVYMGDGRFAMSKVIREGQFSESESGNTMFNLDSGIGKAMNDFLYSMYFRDRSKFTQTPVLVGRPIDSNTVYTNFFGISYNDWINGYRDIAMKYFRDDVPYWLISNTNSLYQAFSYYRASTDNNLLSRKITDVSGYRPMVKLSMSAIVETEDNIDKNGYAYIPDAELRKILNSALGKGNENTDKITIQEMYTITNVDTFSLGRVKDLTGIELLVNCKDFKASFSLRNDEYNKVNFTDITPFIQLGKSRILSSFTLYGIGDVPDNAILHELKGKFPNISSGYIADGSNTIWIDTWELKGTIDRPLFIREKYSYAMTVGETEFTGMYSVGLPIVDNSSDIVKWKPFNSSTYIPWTQGGYPQSPVGIIEKNKIQTIYSQYPFKFDETAPDGKYTIGFENASGKRSEMHLIVKDHMVFLRYDNEPELAMVSMLSNAKLPVDGVYEVPRIIDGANVTIIGSYDNPRFDTGLSNPAKRVDIHEDIREIYSFMPVQRSDIEIYVHNPNCIFHKPDVTFRYAVKEGGGVNIYPTITLCGKPNSTMKKLAEQRAQDKRYIYREF